MLYSLLMIDLNYKELGSGEPVLILHGLFGTLDNWQTIAKGLSEHFTVFLLDLRNHGRSPHTEGVFDYNTLAEDVAYFMHTHWLYEARVIGHSMGGKTAMQLALNYPDKVKKLVVIDIAPKKYPNRHQAVFDAFFGLDLNTLTDRKAAETYLMQQLNDDVGTVQFLLKNLSRKSNTVTPSGADSRHKSVKGGGFEWKLNLPAIYESYPHILDNVDNPVDNFNKDTLFIRGGTSEHVQDADFADILKLFPKARFETIEGAGHWVHADKPKALFDVLMSFLP